MDNVLVKMVRVFLYAESPAGDLVDTLLLFLDGSTLHTEIC